MAHIPGYNTVHVTVVSHTHTYTISILHNSACLAPLDVQNVFGSRRQANHSPFPKAECGAYCFRDNGSSVWPSDYMFQRESLSASHEKRKKDSIFVGKRAIQQPSLKETSPGSLQLQLLNKALGNHR